MEGAFPETMNSRLFSRFMVDATVSDQILQSLSQAQRDFGFGLYSSTTTGSTNEIIPVFVDEPLQVRRMRDAKCVEFQFLPSIAQRKRHGMWRGDWKPMLPPDIHLANRLADRVELARRTSARPDVLIGAAVAAANVAQDVRFFIDCGFDYICLIIDGCYKPAPGQRVSIAPCDETIDTARKVRDQFHGRSFGIRVAAHGSPRQVAEWLRHGIDAVAIDVWVQDRAPATTAASPVESFGGILIESARTAPSNADWLYSSIRDFYAELRSEQSFFAG
jgi:hypothetical protein